MRYRNSLLCFALACMPSLLPALADHQAKLQHLNQAIATVKQTIASGTQKQTKLLHSLKNDELLINKISNRLTQNHQKIERQQAVLGKLKRRKAQYQQDIAAQKRFLAQQLETTYLLHKTGYFKALLNGEDPNTYQRMLVYQHSINQDCLKRYAKFQHLLAAAAFNEKQIQAHAVALKNLHQQLNTQHQQLKRSHHQRRTTLAELSQTLATKQKKLARLVSDKRSLEALVRRLKSGKAVLARYGTLFQKSYGKLDWPVQGSLIHHFSDKIANSDLSWNASIIKAPMGRPVKAIAPGKVVFAGWMPRYGLLTILDHGKGYMSLYGHNQELTHQEGEWLEAGDKIGTVGDTGGQLSAALYFGLWHNGKPINPENWCRKRRRSWTKGL